MTLPLEELGKLVARKRGSRGIRAVSEEAGVSPATLSRVQNGHMPDLATFAKICRWLDCDPAEFLGIAVPNAGMPQKVVHFRKKKTVTPETAQSLAELILAAQRAKEAKLQLLRR